MRRRTKRNLTLVLGLGLAVAVATAAVLVPGYQALRPELDSGSVWVANSASGQIGAANTAVGALQDVTRVPSGNLEIVQSETAVLLVDSTNGTLRTLDPATSQLGPAVLVPPESSVQLRDDSVLIVDRSKGDVVLTSLADLGTGEALPDPMLELGRGATAVLGDDRIHAASPGLGRVIEVDLASGESIASHRASMSPSAPQLQLSAVGDEWMLYDDTSGTLSTAGWSTRLEFDGVRLQQPSQSGDGIVVATEDSLIRLVPGTAIQDVLISGFAGAAAEPLVRDGCVFSVWSSGAGWSDCGAGVVNLDGFDGTTAPQIRARGASIVATDAGSGSTWSLETGALIDDWLESDDTSSPEGEGDQDAVPEIDTEARQQPPEAVDDQFGARPGRVTVLPVTRNDADPNNDPLVITEISGHPGATVTESGREIRLEVGEDERDDIRLRYTITDGLGGSSSATVEVTLRGEDENDAPEQVVDTTAVSMTGGTITLDALADWVDPDGDPLTLVGIEAESPDAATARPDGRVELRDGGEGGVRRYAITVSDGVESTEGIITVTTTAQPQLTAEPVSAVAHVGQQVVLEPLLHVHGGAGAARLHNVELPAEAAGEVHFERGTIELRPDAAGDLLFPYVVTDGTTTVQGQVRVIVLPAQTASDPPLPLPGALALPPLGTARLDVADRVADPSGATLTVTSVTSSHPSVQASLADLRILRLELVAPLSEPATVEYTLSNGTASATGTITVSEGASATQTPIARDDSVRASPGQAVSVAPMQNDEHPSLLPLTLLPDLVEEPEAGVMFVDGDLITFLAPEEPGTYVGRYEVEGSDGQRATARLTVHVGEPGRGTNQAPEPPALTARVLAGETVDIPVPLAGTDPNGDPVQLLGQSTTASLGTLTRTDATTFRYTAGPYSQGTDEIRYLVADDRNEQAEGVLSIAVVSREEVEALPRASADRAQMRPGTSLAVDVLSNDVDAASLPLRISAVDVTRGDAEAEIDGDAVVVTAGEEEDDIGIVYTVENELGASSTAWLTVEVREDAEPPRPVGGDIDVPLGSIIDAETTWVDPLEVASVADGRADLLSVEVAGGGDDVTLSDDGALRIPVRETARELAYRVTRSDTGTSAYGIIRVPGTRDSLPQLRSDVEPIRVVSGETVRIDINDYIIAATGRPVWITDASMVRPTYSNGDRVVRDSQTIEFTSAVGYVGPANVSMEVTDGDSPQDPEGRVGLVVLPIDVVAGEDVPPTLVGTTFAVEPGETRTVDLTRMTIDPADRPDALAYRVVDDAAPDVTLDLDRALLRMNVAPDADVGTTQQATVGVASDGLEGVEAMMRFAIVSSTRPLVQPAVDQIDLERGESEQLQPLDNDEPTNPFPQPLRIDRVEVGEQGVSATVGADGRTVTVSASSAAPIETVSVRYRVLDATLDTARAVWGTIRVRIQDAPERPEPPQQIIDRFERGTLFVQVQPPDDNNSPLTAIRLIDHLGVEHACSLTGECIVRGLDEGVDYRFSAVAENALGESAPSAPSAPMHIDALPSPVTGVTARPGEQPGQLRIQWRAATVPAGGTAVEGYLVRVTGPGVDTVITAGADARSTTVSGLQPNEPYEIAVAATNQANVAEGLWQYSSPPLIATAVGVPGTTAVAIIDGQGTVSVEWDAVSPNGAAGIRYTAQVIPAAEQDSFRCHTNADGTPVGQRGTRVDGLSLPGGQESVVAVVADNGWFCSTSFSSTRHGRPGAVPAGVEVGVGVRGDSADPRVTAMPTLRPGHQLQVQLRIGTSETTPWQTVAGSGQRWLAVDGVGRGSSVDVFVRQVVTNGGVQVAGAATQLPSVVPFSLRAAMPASCTQNQVFEVELPANTVGGDTDAEMQIMLGGVWSEHDREEPLPLGVQQVRLKVSVTYDGAVYESELWQRVECL